ncbi:MAG TPA: tetratricopeptide repeat protein [Gemmatimonadales bacterium]|nr:tetratricopeptide repeat protein [Gemmatimonadales bacterium]
MISLLQAAELNRRGLRYKAAGRFSEARRCYERALELLRLMVPADTDALATIHHNLGGIDHAVGAFASGELTARKGIALRLSQAVHPRILAADLIALAALVDGQNRFDEGERLYLAGLTLLRLEPKPDRVEIAVALNGLGVQYARRGRHRAAIRLLRRSARIKREEMGPTHPSLALTIRNLALAGQRRPAASAGRGFP